MKKSMMDRISKKKMSRSKMKNCGDIKERERDSWVIEYSIYQGGDKDHRGITDTCRWRVEEVQIEENGKEQTPDWGGIK